MIRLFHNVLPARLGSLIERHARWTVIVTFLGTVVFASALTQLRFENAPGKLDLPLDDPVRLTRDRFESRFGGGEALLIGLEFDRVIDAEGLRLIRQLSRNLNNLDGVLSVYSIADATEFVWVQSFGLYVLRPRPVMPKIGHSNETDITEPLNRLLNNPLYKNTLLSSDGRSTVLVLSVDPWRATGSSGLGPLKRLVDEIKRITGTAEDQNASVYYAGSPILNIALQKAMRHDVAVFGPISLAAFILILFLIFRSWRLVLAGCVTSLISLVWALGLLPMTGTPMSIGLSMIIPLILAISLMYSVHYLSCIYRSGTTNSHQSRVTLCWSSLIIPSLFCGITTCVGFLSLGVSPLPGIREVGLFVGSGVFATMLLANLSLPAMLNLLNWSPIAGGREVGDGIVTRLLDRLRALILPRPGLFVAIVILLTVVIGYGVVRLKVETNHLAYLARDKAVTESFHFIDANFGGVLPLEILVDFPEGEGPKAINHIRDFEDSLRALPGIGSVISAADLIRQAEQSKPQIAAPFLPPLHLDKGFIPAEVWNLAGDQFAGSSYLEHVDSMITLRIGCRVHIGSSDQLQRLLEEVNGLAERYLADYRTTITGLSVYFARVEEYVVSTQISSFALSLVVTVLLLGLLSGSIGVGLAVIAVNVLPVVIILGVMGWLAVPLDISTVMIASIALGMVVDDTIHLIYRYRIETAAGKTVEVSMANAFKEVGLPVAATSIILAVGFASFLPARFIPTAYFGGLSALTIIVAGAADMLLLPALIIVLTRRSPDKIKNR